MSRTTIPLRTPRQREHAHRMIDRAPESYVMVLREETRNDAMNRALWGYIKQLREALPEFGKFSPEDCKNILMHALGAEMRFLPELDGGGMFPVGYRSSQLTMQQFGALLEVIQAYAAKHGVKLVGGQYD